MTLSEITTEDGVKLENGMDVYMLVCKHDSEGSGVKYATVTGYKAGCVTLAIHHGDLNNPFALFGRVPVHGTRAVGLWRVQATLESGLGRGA
jgi:hypothetical protein